MGLITETVWVGIGGNNKKYYKDLGYLIPEVKNNRGQIITPKGTKIKVNINDLQKSSNIQVEYTCDKCENLFKTIFNNYKRNLHNNKSYCQKCSLDLYGKYNLRTTKINNGKSFYQWCIFNKKQDILEKWDYDLNNCSPNDITYNSTGFNNKGYWFKCLENLGHTSEIKNLGNLTRKCIVVCNQCNSFAQYLLNTYGKNGIEKYWSNENSENPWEISKCSAKLVKLICPNCFNIISTIPNRFINYKLSCPKCSDGISYPEKFIYNMLQQLKEIKKIKEFNYQKSFNWSKCINNTNSKLNGRKIYDFYIYEFNGIILEIQGGHHYNGGFKTLGGKNKNEEIENDSIKENLSKPYVKHYIKIKCDESSLEQIKENIVMSDLPKVIGFNELDIDWIKCNKYASISKVKEVCDLWNKGIKNNKDISKITYVSTCTVHRYLKRGAECGLCDYNTINAINQGRVNGILSSKKRRSKAIICTTTKIIYPSTASAENLLCINNICRCCKGKGNYKFAGKLPDGTPLRWQYLDEYMQQNGYTDPKDIPGVTIYEENNT